MQSARDASENGDRTPIRRTPRAGSALRTARCARRGRALRGDRRACLRCPRTTALRPCRRRADGGCASVQVAVRVHDGLKGLLDLPVRCDVDDPDLDDAVPVGRRQTVVSKSTTARTRCACSPVFLRVASVMRDSSTPSSLLRLGRASPERCARLRLESPRSPTSFHPRQSVEAPDCGHDQDRRTCCGARRCSLVRMGFTRTLGRRRRGFLICLRASERRSSTCTVRSADLHPSRRSDRAPGSVVRRRRRRARRGLPLQPLPHADPARPFASTLPWAVDYRRHSTEQEHRSAPAADDGRTRLPSGCSVRQTLRWCSWTSGLPVWKQRALYGRSQGRRRGHGHGPSRTAVGPRRRQRASGSRDSSEVERPSPPEALFGFVAARSSAPLA